MEKHLISELEKADLRYRTAQVKIESLQKQVHHIDNLEQQLKNSHYQLKKAMKNEEHFDLILNEKIAIIDSLQKENMNNRHVFDSDQDSTNQMYRVLQEYKERLADVENELAQYKNQLTGGSMTHNNASNTLMLEKELSKMDQINKNKLISIQSQVDEWRSKFKYENNKAQQLEKQLKRVNGNEFQNDNDIFEQLRYMFSIEDDEDVLEKLEQLKVDLDTLDLMKQELDKAKQINSQLREQYNKLKEQFDHLIVQNSSGNTSDYLQELINQRNKENEHLSDELVFANRKLDQAEKIKFDAICEKNELLSTISDLKRVIKDRQIQLERMENLKSDAENNAQSYKEASTVLIKEKKELQRQLQDISKQDDYEKSQSSKDYDNLKKESSGLINFILSLEFAYDEDLDNLFKNQSWANEFDRAKKHLENQKEMVNLITERLEKEYDSMSNDIKTYKEQNDSLQKDKEDIELAKTEWQKWKQSYERLTITLKSSHGSEDKELKDILGDYKKLQDKLTDLQSENSKKEQTIQDLKEKVQKLEEESRRCYSEIENQKRISKDFHSKYQNLQEKISQINTLEAKWVAMERENQSLIDQNTVLKKTNSEQLKSLSNAPTELLSTINGLKSSIGHKEQEVKQLRAEKDILENLLDEAREEFKQNNDQSDGEQSLSFNDALEMMDFLISRPLNTSSGYTSKEFSYVLKRVQQLKDQTEEHIVYKMINNVKHWVATDFSEKEERCKGINDYKRLLSQMFAWYKDSYKIVSFNNQSDTEGINASTESRSIRKPYGCSDISLDISDIFDQYIGLVEHSKNKQIEKTKQETASSIADRHEKYVETLTTELIEKFESERQELKDQFNHEKETEIKQRENKIKADFESKRIQMQSEFESLKTHFNDQFSMQAKKYEGIANEDIQKQKSDFEKQKKMYEQEFSERIQVKTTSLEKTFELRKAELEDEHKIKQQRLEFEMKTKAETQDFKNKTELEGLVSKIETQCQEKVRRIEAETEEKVKELQEMINKKEEEIKSIKLEHEKKLKDHRKVIDREIKFKGENLDKESKIKLDREAKKYQEVIEDHEEKLKDLESKLAQEKQKHKELQKSSSDKHKAEIKNLKSTHENELIRKKIEHNKDLKKAVRDLEIEIDSLKKQHEQEIKEKLTIQKSDLAASNSQKSKLEKSSYEQALLEKENEFNQRLREKEIELSKLHEQEMEQLKDVLMKNHDKLLNSAIENTRAEVKDQYRQEFEHEVCSVTEKAKNQYQTENYSLKLKLQELYEIQSNATNQEDRMISMDGATKIVNESLHSENGITTEGNLYKRSKPGNDYNDSSPFDYDKLSNIKIEVGTQWISDKKSQDSVQTTQNNPEIIRALYSKNMQDMNTLQNRYELKITELLEKHMEEILETKKVATMDTVKKLERILVLEFQKLYQMQQNEAADLIIEELIRDLTADRRAVTSLNNITNTLNQALKKYKEKVDLKAKQTKNKLEKDYVLEKKKLQDEYQLMRDQVQKEIPESPSVLDTGDEHGISSENRIRNSVTKGFSDFTKEFKLCDKETYDKNIITKVSPAHDGKAIIVNLERIVSDLNMIKSSLSAAAKQLGFAMVEPHKNDQAEFQEQCDPNIPEPVYNMSHQYRHLLNTFLRFSRDLILQSNGGEGSTNYFRQAEDELFKHKQEVMKYQLKLSDMKDQFKKSQNELKMLQKIFQNHCESRLQIVDFSIYDRAAMTEATKKIIEEVKNMHGKIMDFQSVFLTNGDNIEQINEQCYQIIREMEEHEEDGESDEEQAAQNRLTAASQGHTVQTILENDHQQRIRVMSVRKNYEDEKGGTYTAQIPRPSFVGGSVTARSNCVSPRGPKQLDELVNRGSTDSTKNPYTHSGENNQSSSKPPKFKRESRNDNSRGRCMQERYKINQPNKSLERHNSFDFREFNHSRNKTGLASTQSLKNLSNFMATNSFRDQDDLELSKAQESMNTFIKNLMK